MQNLKNLVQKANLTQHKQDEVIVDQFAKSVINKVFDELSVIFPAWKHAWPTEKELAMAKLQWTKAFVENNIVSMEQIRYGFLKARQSESDFLPSCGRFVSWCSPTATDLGFPSEQQAMKLCVAHRNATKMNLPSNAKPFIIELCKRVDWWIITTASTQIEHRKAESAFKDEYLALINSGYQEPTETTHSRLETSEIVKDRMSPQQLEDGRKRGLECVKDIKRKLAANKLKGE
jgi:hypothetical protein